MLEKIKNINGASCPQLDLLFESSWEVCNKVGGIYTVLSTKARVLKNIFGDRLIFIGPDIWTEDNPSPSFIERKTLLKKAASRLQLPDGLKIRVGRWDIPGSPLVVLVNDRGLQPRMNDIYGKIWQSYGVDSLHANGDYDDSCRFAVASAIVMRSLTEWLGADPLRVAAHFDEWTTGMGLLWLEHEMPQAATIFTAHATCIGRSICSNGKPLYDYFTGYNGDQMAGELNMVSKHSLESRAARNADCFTTVSETTARESEQLLGVRPQIVTPNGFEQDFVPDSVRYERLRVKGRKRLLDIASELSGMKYEPDTLIVATSGRNEYRNKGLDIFLDSMACLDARLQKKDMAKSVVAFVLVPAWVKEPSAPLVFNMKEGGSVDVMPDFVTHRLNNEDSDSVFRRIAELESHGSLKHVKVVYVPCYLDGHDGVVDINYYQLLPALDLTIFPSYYEPWGYTPLESVSFGIPTVTTDKSGFGQWVIGQRGNGLSESGVEVLERTDSNYNSVVEKIADIIASFATETDGSRNMISESARRTSEAADWSRFIPFYCEAYATALRRRDERMNKK